MIKVLVEIDRLLNAILIDLLSEIPVPIEQTYCNEIQIKIAGRFAMVAGENAEAAGVIRDRLMETKFSGKIGDRIFDRAAGACFSVRVVSSEILFEVLKNLLELAQKIFVLCKLFQPGLPGKLQHAHGVVIRAVPQFWIEMPEQAARGRLPRPPKVETHLPQRFQRRRQDGSHIVSLKSRHALGVAVAGVADPGRSNRKFKQTSMRMLQGKQSRS